MGIKRYLRALYSVITGKKKLCLILIEPYTEKTFDLHKDYILNKETIGNFKQLVAIDGQGYSGSSAITDYLAEFSCNTTYGGVEMHENPDRGLQQCFEVDFVRDPHSVLDLERICYHKVGRLKDNAVQEFVDFVNLCYDKGPKSLYHNENFLYYSKEFIKKFIYFPYGNGLHAVNYNISLEEYKAATKEYLHNILNNISNKENLVLDNVAAIGEPNLKLINDYFPENTKILYSYRDPRDEYVSARNYIWGDTSWVPTDPNEFIKQYLRVFPQFLKAQCSQIKCVRFEEFVYDYDRVSKEINEFLGISENEHIKKFAYFDPKKSCNNIGVYKNYKNQDAIKIIENALKEYCFDDRNAIDLTGGGMNHNLCILHHIVDSSNTFENNWRLAA